MGEIARCVVGSIVLTLIGGLLLAAGMIDRRVVGAQRAFAAERYERADEALAPVERYLGFGGWIPWIGAGPLNEVRTRRASIRYWSGQYDRIVSDGPDPVTAMSSDNIELQLVVANAVYRRGQARGGDRQAVLDALQAATSAYLAVLRNAPPAEARASEAAAYNYEYVVRTRDDIDKGRHAPELTDTAEDGPAGRRGNPPPDSNKRDLKILVPLAPAEMDKGIEPGKGGVIERKG